MLIPFGWCRSLLARMASPLLSSLAWLWDISGLDKRLENVWLLQAALDGSLVIQEAVLAAALGVSEKSETHSIGHPEGCLSVSLSQWEGRV